MDKSSGFYNKLIKSWLQDNINLLFAAQFIRTFLKDKMCKYMTSVPRNVIISKLLDIFTKYNITYCSKIKLKSFDIKSSAYIDFCTIE